MTFDFCFVFSGKHKEEVAAEEEAYSPKEIKAKHDDDTDEQPKYSNKHAVKSETNTDFDDDDDDEQSHENDN